MTPDDLQTLLDVATHGEVHTIRMPWPSDKVIAFQKRHRHDPRLSCEKAEACGQVCGVMEEARERILDALPLLLDLWRAAALCDATIAHGEVEKDGLTFCGGCRNPWPCAGVKLLAALRALDEMTP